MFRTAKYVLACILHVVAVAVALKLCNFVLPSFVLCFFSTILHFVVVLFIARYTFVFTKQKFLKENISPHKKAVLITGCDSGFGHYLAKRLDSKGFHVFASCLFPTGKGAEELRNQCSDRLKVLEMDVTKDDCVTAAFRFVKDNLGNSVLWAVVNNAGIQKGFTADLASLKDFKDTMEVNGFGMVRVTKIFLPLLKQSRGRIVNMTSLNGRVAVPHNTPYVMSKFAAAGFSDSLRMEMRDWGIRVIEIEPELFQTMIIDLGEIEKRCIAESSGVDPTVVEEYGTKYFEDLKAATIRFLKMCSSNKVDRVVDALDDAVTSEYPSISYRPSRNYPAYVTSTLLEIVPLAVLDAAIGFSMRFVSFPKPKSA